MLACLAAENSLAAHNAAVFTLFALLLQAAALLEVFQLLSLLELVHFTFFLLLVLHGPLFSLFLNPLFEVDARAHFGATFADSGATCVGVFIGIVVPAEPEHDQNFHGLDASWDTNHDHHHH